MERGQLLVLGFSGGADSLCLAGLLAELGWPVIAAHFDHRLRAESGEDALRAGELAGKLGIRFVQGAGDVRAAAENRKEGLEAAARQERYTFLFETARRFGAAAVCTAHTANDQAETLLLRLLRGAGARGLGGMAQRRLLAGFDRELPLIRPLLDFSREETEAWCATAGLVPVQDSSNREAVYLRNRLRLETLPHLEELNPAAVSVLARSAGVLQRQAEVLTEVAAMDSVIAGVDREREATTLERAPLLQMSEARLLNLLSHLLRELGGAEAEFGEEVARQLRGMILRPPRGGSARLPENLQVRISGGKVRLTLGEISPWLAEFPALTAEVPLPAKGRVELQNGWVLEVSRERVPEQWPDDLAEAWLALESEGTLSIRPPRMGDAVQWLGGKGKTQALNTVFVNGKVPREARGNWPVVVGRGEVIWVPSLRRSNLRLVGPGAVEALRLRLIKQPKPGGD